MFRPRFNDDRGKGVLLHPLGELVAHRTARERWIVALRAVWGFARSPLGLMCLSAIIGVTVVASLTIDSGPWVLFLFIFSPVGGTTVLVLLLIGIGTRRLSAERAAKLRDTMLAKGHCPVCAYELNRATIEPDGCVVCPECSAAWKGAELSVPPAVAGSERKVVVSDSLSESRRR